MSKVTLHGYPVKVGDMVWSLSMPCGNGWGMVASINDSEFPIAVKFGDGNVYYYDINRPIIFWKPIDPSAIEAAKVKPNPVEYSYRWYSDVLDHTSSRMTQFEWNKFYVKQRDDANNWVRIEESKREVRT